MGIVDFQHARKMAARGLSAVDATFDRFYRGAERTAGQAGAPIEVTPFTPGTVSTGAVLAKLATSVFANARQRANDEELRKSAEARRAYLTAESRMLDAKVAPRKLGMKLPDGTELQLTDKEYGDLYEKRNRKSTGKPSTIKLTKDQYGMKAGTEVDRDEYLERGRSERAGNRKKAAGEYTAAMAETRNVDAQTERGGPAHLKALAQGQGWADRLVSDITNPKSTSAQRKQAAAMLGVSDRISLPSDMDQLEMAKKSFIDRFVVRQLATIKSNLAPRRAAAEAVVQRSAGLLGPEEDGMSDQEREILRQFDDDEE